MLQGSAGPEAQEFESSCYKGQPALKPRNHPSPSHLAIKYLQRKSTRRHCNTARKPVMCTGVQWCLERRKKTATNVYYVFR
ncbi:hypothetical protein RRG08_002846 [Elysia crispata]|uniref:Uncharacterized protein n=1 Tax=Elysia crispata TaxID=231223 RepID=A0AAE0XUL7_9GAST|nr:hypothetical protein RRG08_002846 [Elysia crispata]